jgi:hypothetical protein
VYLARFGRSHLTERTRAQLGEESWHRAWSAGNVMTLEQPVACGIK